MALATFSCTNCQKTFEAGSWFCKSGEPHTVASKTYYVLDAPADKRDCKNARLQIMNIIPERSITEPGGHTRVMPGHHIEFIRGLFETDNPQIQLALDKRRNVHYGEEGKKLWEAAYFSNEEKAEFERLRLNREITRLQNENNALLNKVMAEKEVAV